MACTGLLGKIRTIVTTRFKKSPKPIVNRSFSTPFCSQHILGDECSPPWRWRTSRVQCSTAPLGDGAACPVNQSSQRGSQPRLQKRANTFRSNRSAPFQPEEPRFPEPYRSASRNSASDP
jgi:hypothetical protein